MAAHRDHTGAVGLVALVLFAVSVIVICAVSIYGLAGNWLQTSRFTSRSADALDDARRYVLGRPFDSAGWLAWTGTAHPLSTDLSPLAVKVIDAATSLGPVDPQVLRARALLALKRGDISGGLERVADIATYFPAERKDAFTTLLAYVGDPAWTAFLQGRLKSGWPAIEPFLVESCQGSLALPSLLGLAQQVVRNRALTDETIACIGNKAIAEGQVPAAYWLWLNASPNVPRSVGNVFNGDFELPAAGRLFDWRLGPGGEYREGFAVAVRRDASRGRENNVLMIRFNGRALRLPIAQQFLALSPGRYVFSYAAREVGAITPGIVTWTLSCVPPKVSPTPGVLRSQPLGSGWVTRTQEISVPAGCDGQLLELTVGNRLQMLQGLQGSIFFDDISMTRQ